MTINRISIVLIIIILMTLSVPIFYLVQYLDAIFGHWWNLAWIVFMITVGIIVRKTGWTKGIPQTRKYSLINVAIPTAILSGVIIYAAIVTGHVSLPLLLFFGGLIALGILIYAIQVKLGK